MTESVFSRRRWLKCDKVVTGEQHAVSKEAGESGGLKGRSERKLPGGRYVIPIAWCNAETSLLAGSQVMVISPQVPLGEIGGISIRWMDRL